MLTASTLTHLLTRGGYVPEERIVDKVRKLWALADHPNTSKEEAAAASEQARKLMAKYAIDELMVEKNKGVGGASRDIIMLNIRITEEGRRVVLKDQRVALSWIIARHNRCRGVVRDMQETVDPDTGKVVPAGFFLTVVGFRHDCEFVKELYFGLVMDMMDALMNEPSQKPNYQAEFAAGFAERIDSRLQMMGALVEEEATKGDLLPVLRDRKTAVDDFFTKAFPNLGTAKISRRTQYDPNARNRGAKAADRADVGQTKVGGSRKALES